MKKGILSVVCLFLMMSVSAFSQTWTLQTAPTPNTGFNGACAVDANIVWMCGPGGIVIRTTNGGATWAFANTGLTGNDFYTISAIDANTAEAGAGDGGMWRTTNGGVSWTFQVLPGTPPPVFMDVVHFFDSQNGFALSDPAATAGLWNYYITTNAGLNWQQGANRPPNAAGEAGWNGSYAAVDTGHIWWGTNASKIWHGGFRGPFTAETTPALNSFTVAFSDINTGVAGMTNASFAAVPTVTTVNGGTTWTNSAFTPNAAPFAMKPATGTNFVWLGSLSIYRSTDKGVTWTSQQSLTTTNEGFCLTMVNENTGWCGTGNPAGGTNGLIYVYHDVLGIDPNNSSVPKSFNLEQNYPNPFNPTTNIKYSIPVASQVTIKVYDVIGHEVATVVNKYEAAGNYIENFNASNLASGIYFYSIKAGDYSATKKMSLIK